jgi:hypothetical protein
LWKKCRKRLSNVYANHHGQIWPPIQKALHRNFRLAILSYQWGQLARIKISWKYRNIESTTTLAILQISNVYHKTFQIVDYTMTNIQNFSLVIIVSSVPEAGNWRDQEFVRYASVRCKLLWWWVYSRKMQFSKLVYSVS